MDRRKVLGLKENLVLKKKMTLNNLALQIIRIILRENLQKIYLQVQRKKVLVLRERKNLKVEVVDLKILALKNIAKKDTNLKIF